MLDFIRTLGTRGARSCLFPITCSKPTPWRIVSFFMDKGRTVDEVSREATNPTDLTERLLALAEGGAA